jgi:CheY-like chemotaxis protein
MSAHTVNPIRPVAPGFQRVLCVEANSSRRRELFATFARPGLTVECVCDGAEALDHVKKYGAPDLLVTAHDLPEFGGLALVCGLRRAGFSGRVIVTCHTLSDAATDAYRALRVTTILAPPLPAETLLAAADLPSACPSSPHP